MPRDRYQETSDRLKMLGRYLSFVFSFLWATVLATRGGETCGLQTLWHSSQEPGDPGKASLVVVSAQIVWFPSLVVCCEPPSLHIYFLKGNFIWLNLLSSIKETALNFL